MKTLYSKHSFEFLSLLWCEFQVFNFSQKADFFHTYSLVFLFPPLLNLLRLLYHCAGTQKSHQIVYTLAFKEPQISPPPSFVKILFENQTPLFTSPAKCFGCREKFQGCFIYFFRVWGKRTNTDARSFPTTKNNLLHTKKMSPNPFITRPVGLFNRGQKKVRKKLGEKSCFLQNNFPKHVDL